MKECKNLKIGRRTQSILSKKNSQKLQFLEQELHKTDPLGNQSRVGGLAHLTLLLTAELQVTMDSGKEEAVFFNCMPTGEPRRIQ